MKQYNNFVSENLPGTSTAPISAKERKQSMPNPAAPVTAGELLNLANTQKRRGSAQTGSAT